MWGYYDKTIDREDYIKRVQRGIDNYTIRPEKAPEEMTDDELRNYVAEIQNWEADMRMGM